MPESQKPPIRTDDEAIKLVSDALAARGLTPTLVPNDKLGSLRGNVVSIDLSGLRGVDAAVIISSTPQLFSSRSYSKERHYRVDYAVRGNVRQLPPDKIVAVATPMSRGLFKRGFSGVVWSTPYTTLTTRREKPPEPTFDGDTPFLGEAGEGSPFYSLVMDLKLDLPLSEAIADYLNEVGELNIRVITDPFGESIRITGFTAFGNQDLTRVYCSEEYLRIADSICLHVKALRKRFGGFAY